jgi:hypothetical protein
MNKFIIRIIVGCLYSINALSYAQPMENQPVTLQNLLTLQPEDMSNIMSNGGALTITGSGTIHFLQAFFYSDSSCTTLLGGASAINNVTGMTFSTGQTVNINSSSVYQLANNQGITTGNIACMQVFLNGSNLSPSGISCQSFTDETCTGTTCTSNQTKSVNWISNPTPCRTQYAYIPNRAPNTVSQCTVDSSTGALSSCGTTGAVPLIVLKESLLVMVMLTLLTMVAALLPNAASVRQQVRSLVAARQVVILRPLIHST